MIKKFKWPLILSSIAIILPVIVGLCIWNILPDAIPTHFGIDGNPDSFASKAFAVFGLAGIMLAVHWLCIICSVKLDPKSKNILSSKAFNLVLWISPAVCLICYALMYLYALGVPVSVGFILSLFMGLLFIIIGNYLPKCKQSYTMGIKLPWTLNDEENWNKTHRFGGFVWVIGGAVILATSFLANFWILIAVLVFMVALPTIYSYNLYRNSKATKPEEEQEKHEEKLHEDEDKTQ